MTQLYLIRHGEAMSAIHGFIGDGGLSPLGVIQAEHLRKRLAETGEIEADVLISSTLPRAHQTAQIIAPALDLPILLDDDIQEFRPGEAEGMTVEEFRKKYGEPDYEHDPYRPMAPGGENWAQFTFRVGTALDRIIREHAGKTIVLVCHGGIIDGSFLFFYRMSTWRLPPARFYTRNTSITQWKQMQAFNGEEHWYLIRYNDAFHLRDVGTHAAIPWRELLPMPASDADRPSVPIQTESTMVRDKPGEPTDEA
jgi:2,3-bisphosphoglycerate-dependent phosphoglycerate mutase